MRAMQFGAIFSTFLVLFLSPVFLAHAETPFSASGLVRQKCSACHKLDKQGRMEVIEETRKSPEEWKVVVDRMIRINGGPVSDDEFDPVIKELSRHLILTPDEMARVAYINSDENSQYREYPADKTEERIFAACVRCHTYGKILSHRKTREQWQENMNLHLGYYPTTVAQLREMDWPKEAAALVDVLAERLPMDTPEWRTWMAQRKKQQLEGKWIVAGYQPGYGYYEGAYTFTMDTEKGRNEYRVVKEVRYLNGTQFTQAGEATLYGEYHLRYKLSPTPLTGRVEGVFDLDATEMSFQGKWWTVVQDTNAFGNETFYQEGLGARVIALFPQALKKTGKVQDLTLVGVDLPGRVTANQLRFVDRGIKIVEVAKQGDSVLKLKVRVGVEADNGPSSLALDNVDGSVSLIAYDRIDGIRILPALGRARVSSGAAYPPHGVQFVARAVNFGKDGKPNTKDDMMLEPVRADWWLEEEKTREGDDDLKYLQTSVVNGLYTPTTTYGPMESRVQRREGIGLIAIGASYEDADSGEILKDRSLLGVTVPDFITHIK